MPFLTAKEILERYIKWLPVRMNSLNESTPPQGGTYTENEVFINLKGLLKYPF